MSLARISLLIAVGVALTPGQCAWERAPGNVPGGMDSLVSRTLVHDDGTGAALYAGGLFQNAGTAVAGAIARWDGATWSTVGNGLATGSFCSVEAMATTSAPAARLYAALRDRTGPQTVVSIHEWDGSAWTQLGPNFPPGNGIAALTIHDAGSGPELYLALNQGNSATVHRWSGTSWGTIGTFPGFVGDLASYDDGTGSALHAGGSLPGFIQRWTGTVWQALPAAPAAQKPVMKLHVHDAGFGPLLLAGGEGDFIAPSFIGGFLEAWDGATWTDLGAPAPVTALLTMDWGSGPVLVRATGGEDLDNSVDAWDGTTWTHYTSVGMPFPTGGTDSQVDALAAFPDASGQALYLAGRISSIMRPGFRSFVGNICRFRLGTGLSALSDSFDGRVQSVRRFGWNGQRELVVAGFFSEPEPWICRWDGQGFSPFPDPLPGPVLRLEATDTSEGPTLPLAALHRTAGFPANAVSLWDGAGWQSIGTTSSSDLEALFIEDGALGPRVFIGGILFSVAGVPVRQIARYENGAWQDMGQGPGGMSGLGVLDIVRFDAGDGDRIYAAGRFAGGVEKWDGATWIPVAPGLPGWGERLAVFDDGAGPRLYVTSNGPSGSARGLYRLDGNTWTQVGALPGIGSAYGLRVVREARGAGLVMTGFFSSVNGVPANGLARFDGTTWEGYAPPALASPSYEDVADFDFGDGWTTVLGGGFTVVGGAHSPWLTTLRCPSPVLDLDQPGGAGTPVIIANRGLVPGLETFNVFSLAPCALAPGGGPYAGLCAPTAADLTLLICQVTLPVGSLPFHFIPSTETFSIAAIGIPPGPLEGVTLTVPPIGPLLQSPVTRIVVQ